MTSARGFKGNVGANVFPAAGNAPDCYTAQTNVAYFPHFFCGTKKHAAQQKNERNNFNLDKYFIFLPLVIFK